MEYARRPARGISWFDRFLSGSVPLSSQSAFSGSSDRSYVPVGPGQAGSVVVEELLVVEVSVGAGSDHEPVQTGGGTGAGVTPPGIPTS